MNIFVKIQTKILKWLDQSQEIHDTAEDSQLTLGKLLAECSQVGDLDTPVGVCAIWSQGTFSASGVFYNGEKLVIYVEERRKDSDKS